MIGIVIPEILLVLYVFIPPIYYFTTPYHAIWLKTSLGSFFSWLYIMGSDHDRGRTTDMDFSSTKRYCTTTGIQKKNLYRRDTLTHRVINHNLVGITWPTTCWEDFPSSFRILFYFFPLLWLNTFQFSTEAS